MNQNYSQFTFQVGLFYTESWAARDEGKFRIPCLLKRFSMYARCICFHMAKGQSIISGFVNHHYH